MTARTQAYPTYTISRKHIRLPDMHLPRPCMVGSLGMLLGGLSIPVLMLLGLIPLSLLIGALGLALVLTGSVLALVFCGEII